MMFQDLDEVEKYDGIWACASILHVKKAELPSVLRKMSVATKSNGIIYVSFKYGDFEGERNGRYFTDMTVDSMAQLLEMIPELRIEKQWITGDVRAGRGTMVKYDSQKVDYQLHIDPAYCYKFYWLEAIVQLICQIKKKLAMMKLSMK